MDRQYNTICAVFRMLKREKIKLETAIHLLENRAKLSKYSSRCTAEIWAKHLKANKGIEPCKLF